MALIKRPTHFMIGWLALAAYLGNTSASAWGLVLCEEGDGRVAIEFASDHLQCFGEMTSGHLHDEAAQTSGTQRASCACEACPCEDTPVDIEPAVLSKKSLPPKSLLAHNQSPPSLIFPSTPKAFARGGPAALAGTTSDVKRREQRAIRSVVLLI
ncbi:MAG: hypothetical protein O7F17_08470 [Planctomycetota bacterium]|nr:hypothetical protein [Planctomycetota bacterium]